jgi:hypothetical protein
MGKIFYSLFFYIFKMNRKQHEQQMKLRTKLEGNR